MSIEKLTPFVIGLLLLASNQKNLLKTTDEIRKAEFQLIQKSKASKWPSPPMLKEFKRN